MTFLNPSLSVTENIALILSFGILTSSHNSNDLRAFFDVLWLRFTVQPRRGAVLKHFFCTGESATGKYGLGTDEKLKQPRSIDESRNFVVRFSFTFSLTHFHHYSYSYQIGCQTYKGFKRSSKLVSLESNCLSEKKSTDDDLKKVC